jgi:acyl-CoA thioester hydrolase
MEPTAGYFEGREHRLPIRVYYEDTDFTGLVYHGNYVKFFERGRSDFLRLAGLGHSSLLEREDPLAFVVTHMELRFLKPARIDDGLLVRTWYERVRGPRLFITQRITRGDEELCRAAVQAACIDLSGRPRKPAPGMRERIRPWLADDDET